MLNRGQCFNYTRYIFSHFFHAAIFLDGYFVHIKSPIYLNLQRVKSLLWVAVMSCRKPPGEGPVPCYLITILSKNIFYHADDFIVTGAGKTIAEDDISAPSAGIGVVRPAY